MGFGLWALGLQALDFGGQEIALLLDEAPEMAWLAGVKILASGIGPARRFPANPARSGRKQR
jgi:hypothetical protein